MSKALLAVSTTMLLSLCPALASADDQSAPPPPNAIPFERSLEACTNGVDDDQDGFRDCYDQDCQLFAVCVQRVDPSRSSTHEPKPERRHIPAFVATSVISLGLAHLASIGTVALITEGDQKAIGYSAVPLAGPFIVLAAVPDADHYSDSLIPLGIAQVSAFILSMVAAGVRVPVSKPGHSEVESSFEIGMDRASFTLSF